MLDSSSSLLDTAAGDDGRAPPLSRVNAMLELARARPSVPHVAVVTQPEYIPLPVDSSGDSIFYTVDTTVASQQSLAATASVAEENECPSHLDDMLVIVRSLRQVRQESLAHAGLIPSAVSAVMDTTTTTPPSSQIQRSSVIFSSSASSEQQPPPQRRGANNMTVRNFSDLFDLE